MFDYKWRFLGKIGLVFKGKFALFALFLSLFCVNFYADEMPTKADFVGDFIDKKASNANLSTNLANQANSNTYILADLSNSINSNADILANKTDSTNSNADTSTILENQPTQTPYFTADLENETAKNDDFADEFDDEFESEFAQDAVFDPLSGYNRFMTDVNMGLYRYMLRPIASGYDFIVPDTAQSCISNFFSYLATPLRLAGNLLQLKFAAVGDELKRFGYNTIFGFFGLIDAASKAGVPLHHADFGLVLAHWGVGGGFHLVLPVLGPSNLRDTLSIPFNWYAMPTSLLGGPSLQIAKIKDFELTIGAASTAVKAFGLLNEASLNTKALDTIYNTPSPYLLLRDGYEKRRAELAK